MGKCANDVSLTSQRLEMTWGLMHSLPLLTQLSFCHPYEVYETVVESSASFMEEGLEEAWEELERAGSRSEKLEPLALDTPKFPDKLRVVCLSDTHGRMGEMLHRIPLGDVLIHAGDFTNSGAEDEVRRFNEELGCLPHKHILVIAGNHEKTFGWGPEKESFHPEALLTSCTYLVDEAVTIEGYKFFGSPWIPGYPSFAYGLSRGEELKEKRKRIPSDTDVLITHGPPLGHGDAIGLKSSLFSFFNHQLAYNFGDEELLKTVEKRVRPKYHVFGHVHGAHGVTTNGETVFINAAIMKRKLHLLQSPSQDPVLFDLPLPHPSHSS